MLSAITRVYCKHEEHTWWALNARGPGDAVVSTKLTKFRAVIKEASDENLMCAWANRYTIPCGVKRMHHHIRAIIDECHLRFREFKYKPCCIRVPVGYAGEIRQIKEAIKTQLQIDEWHP